MNQCRVATPLEHQQGFAMCECGQFAHVFRASVLNALPRDYYGECCPRCSLWMVRAEFIPGAGRTEPAPAEEIRNGV